MNAEDDITAAKVRAEKHEVWIQGLMAKTQGVVSRFEEAVPSYTGLRYQEMPSVNNISIASFSRILSSKAFDSITVDSYGLVLIDYGWDSLDDVIEMDDIRVPWFLIFASDEEIENAKLSISESIKRAQEAKDRAKYSTERAEYARLKSKYGHEA